MTATDNIYLKSTCIDERFSYGTTKQTLSSFETEEPFWIANLCERETIHYKKLNKPPDFVLYDLSSGSR